MATDDQMDYGGAPPPTTSLPTPSPAAAPSTTSLPAPAAPAPTATPTAPAAAPASGDVGPGAMQQSMRPPSMQSRSPLTGGGGFDWTSTLQHPMVQGLFKQLGFSPDMISRMFPNMGGGAAHGAPTAPGATGAAGPEMPLAGTGNSTSEMMRSMLQPGSPPPSMPSIFGRAFGFGGQ